MKTLRYLALAGNVLYILWIVYNGIDEGFQGVGTVQATTFIGMLCLLLLNILFLLKQK